MFVVKYRKIFYTISSILVIASLISLFTWGLLPGIDFTGGTLIEISYDGARPSQSAVTAEITKIDPSASIRPSKASDGKEEYIVRMKTVNATEKASVLAALSPAGTAKSTLDAFDSIGPLLGAEALRKALWSIALVIIAIVLYITFAFRKVSAPVASWKYGLTAIIALVHDVIIPTGVFSVLGHFAGYEVDTLFVTALLVVLGFSVHDTIVVFDRVRENLRNQFGGESFAETVGKSVSQTFTRSINTSLTTIIALIVLYILGGSITEHFTLTLIIGIAIGTYSSIFIGSTLLVTLEGLQKKGKK
ncbi:MAG: protein translocase subunit SecF [Candidatus Taylorbacteria bacterium]|nr:protein translocase subunit SecF [Candidatus Taylorbacteria bacterium]